MNELAYQYKDERDRRNWLLGLAVAHLYKWERTGDIKLLKIADQLEKEALLWGKK